MEGANCHYLVQKLGETVFVGRYLEPNAREQSVYVTAPVMFREGSVVDVKHIAS